MTFMHFFPEFLIALCLFVSLMLASVRVFSQGTLPLVVSGVTLTGLIFFLTRSDLVMFEPATAMIRSDSLSYFGRVLSLLMVTIFGFGAFFHPGFSVRDKQNSTLFILFLSLFVSALFFSQSLVLYLGAAIGIHFCALNLILIEGQGSNHWLKVFRVKSVQTGIGWSIGLLAFLVSSHLFKGIFFDAWTETLSQGAGDWGVSVLLVLLLLLGSLPLINLRFIGPSPYSLGILSFSSLLILQVFWFRMGVPYLHASQVLPKSVAKIMVALLIGGITLRSVYSAIRYREHDTWISSVYPALVGLCLFTVLLPSEHSLQAFQVVSLGLLLTFPLISRAFLDRDSRFKGLIVFSLFAALGAPPFILGEQIFRMMKELIEARDFVAGFMVSVIWLGLAVATIQIIGKVLLIRIPADRKRKANSGDLFFLILYALGTLALTAFQGPLLSLLNDHPLLNLW
jgi:hypothetical protein